MRFGRVGDHARGQGSGRSRHAVCASAGLGGFSFLCFPSARMCGGLSRLSTGPSDDIVWFASARSRRSAVRRPRCARLAALTSQSANLIPQLPTAPGSCLARESRTKCLTAFRRGAIVEFSSTVASRTPSVSTDAEPTNRRPEGHGSCSSLNTLPGCHSRDNTSANHAIDSVRRRDLRSRRKIRRPDSSAPGGASCDSLSTTMPATSMTRVADLSRRRDPLPAPAHRRRSRDVATHHASGDLRDDRAASAAGRHPHSPTRPVSRGRPATLAGPEARAIAEGVKAMSVTLRPYRSGGWEVDITIRLPDGRQYRERKRASRFSKSAAQRWAQDRERYLLQHGPPTAQQGGAHTRSVRAEIRRRSRAGEPSQAERHCLNRIHPEMASGSNARSEASRRDHATNRCSG